MTLRMHLFGSPRLECDGEVFALPFERRSQVLVLAALKRSWVGRAELAAMLWPDQPSKLAYSNVRKTLFRLKSLPWAGHIELQGNAVRFDAQTDVFELESALRERRIAEALPLRGGELLQGFEDDKSEAWSSWLNFERERLRAAWRAAALERLADELEPGEGIELSSRLLEADPLDEAALRAQMTWLAKGGQAVRARQAYWEFTERLSKELGLAPNAEVTALLESMAVQPKPPMPAPSTKDEFVGRAVERRKVAELLAQQDCRLLCIVGPGGMGKTRLARQVLSELESGYTHGATFASLEDVTLPDHFGGRLARELGLSLAGSAQPMDQVNQFLRDRHMLLVLDNVEDFAPQAAMLEKLLQDCPRLKILATSRVRLAISREWSLPLEGLPFPEADDRDHAESFDAVRLFVAAARRVAPGLSPTTEAGAIIDICKLVEGVPLALELAAGWTRVMDCAAIAAELRRGTELLRAVDATRDARHASIEVVFEQSWQQLGAVERATLAKLSIFRGGFTTEAARTVAGASLPVLAALADKSLLRKDGARGYLHSLVRQFLAAHLHGEVRDATEAAHARYFHGLLAQLRSGVENGDREALQRIDMEAANCRAAWAWSVIHGDSQALAKSVYTVLHFCDHRGRFQEGLTAMRAAVASIPGDAGSRFRPLMMSAIAHLEYRLDRYGAAEEAAKEAFAASRETGDHATRLQCFKVLGGCALRRGNLPEAKRWYKQALQQAPANSDPHNAAAMLDNLALVEKDLHHIEESRRMSMESLLQHRLLGDVAGEALCLNNLGSLELDEGDHEAAAAHLSAGLALCDRHGLVSTRGLILTNQTELALKVGDVDVAEERARRALDVVQPGRNPGVEGWLRLFLARIALRRGNLDDARDELRASVELAIAIGRPSLKLACASCFADLVEAQGEPDCARTVRTLAAGAGLDALLHRIALETALAYSSLIESLRKSK